MKKLFTKLTMFAMAVLFGMLLSVSYVHADGAVEGLVYDGVGYKYPENGSFVKNCRRSINCFAVHFGADGYVDKWGFDACKGRWKDTKKGKRYFFEDGKVPYGNWLLEDGKYYTFDNGYVVSSAGSPGELSKASANTTTKSSSNSSSQASSNSSSGNSNNNTSQSSSGSNSNTTESSGSGQTVNVTADESSYVYVSKSGIFHSISNCSGMSTSTPMTLANARSKGYRPCDKCWY